MRQTHKEHLIMAFLPPHPYNSPFRRSLSSDEQQHIRAVQQKLGLHSTIDPTLLQNALTRPSYLTELVKGQIEFNERLELLGDSVLNLAVTHFLHENIKNMPEGKITKIRQSVVNIETLERVAQEIGVDEYIFRGSGANKKFILASTLKAIVGAIFLTGSSSSFMSSNTANYKAAHDFCLRILKDEITVAYNKAISSQQPNS